MSKRTEFAIVTSSGVRAREEEVVRHGLRLRCDTSPLPKFNTIYILPLRHTRVHLTNGSKRQPEQEKPRNV
jgi:hypothetical protein